MATKLLFRNVGDIWDISGDKRVRNKKDQDIINMASCRGLSLLKHDSKLVFPYRADLESYLEHVADFLMPGESKDNQINGLKSKLIPVKLPVGDATSEDYLDSSTLTDSEFVKQFSGCELRPYVDGDRAKSFAERFDCIYHSDFHELFFRVRNKVHFHHFCQQAALPTIPHSIAAGTEGDYVAQCQNIFEAIKSIFEKGYDSVMIRQATAAGGIGNARINKINTNTYEIARSKEVFESDEALLKWLHDDFHQRSRRPGMMVAPYFGDGISLSGIVEILENGEVIVPYIAQEILNEEGTSFIGTKIGNNLPKDYINQAIALLTQAGMAFKKEGVKRGRLQMDMRTVNEIVCAVESNSLRKTAVIEMNQIMADSKDWIVEGAQNLKDGRQKSFMGIEHITVGPLFEQAVKQKGFNQAFNEFRILKAEQVQKYLNLSIDGAHVDIGVMLHSSTPPHYFGNQMNIGLIIADHAIRTPVGETAIKPLPDSLKKLSLEDKWKLVQKVFRS